MKSLPAKPELLNVALADAIHFLAHVMTYGTLEDLEVMSGFVSNDEY